MSRYVLMTCAAISCAGLGLAARAEERKKPSDALKKDVETLQGKWERVMTTETSALGKAKRAIKEYRGNKETVTWYDDKNEIIRSHEVIFELSESGKARVFTFSDMVILHGPQKGQKVTIKGAYIYRVEKGELIEAGGFLQGEEFRRSAPYFARWKKVQEKNK